MKVSRSLSSRLSLYIVLASSIIYFAVFIGIGLMVMSAVEKEAKIKVQNSLSAMTSKVEAVMGGVEKSTESMIWVVKEHLTDPGYMYHITKEHVKQHKEIIGCTIAFSEQYFPARGRYFAPYSYVDPTSGEIQTIQMGNDNYDYFSMPWYADAVEINENIWSDPYFDAGGGNQQMATYSMPIWNAEHNPIAVLTADVSLSKMEDYLSAIDLPYSNSYLFVISASGAILTPPKNPEALNFIKAMKEGLSDTRIFKEKNGQKHTITYAPLSNGWSMAIVCSHKDIYADAHKAYALLFIISLLGFLMLYFSVKMIIRKITQPITLFTYAAMNIATGNFNAKIPEVKTKDEIKKLHDALNFMLQSIKDYLVELKSSTAANERFESELNIAANIQTHMLPTAFPKRDDLDIFATLHPAKEVGGDLYDFFLKDNFLFFAIGDVSGKGVPAALFMAITRSAFRFVADMGQNLNEAMCRINNSFCQGNKSNMFVTLFIARINLTTGEMEYCNAGHNPIILIDAQGRASFLKAIPNLAAGLFEDFDYRDEKAVIAKGSRLLLYTDGVSEAENRTKDLYGEDRLLEFAAGEMTKETSEEFITNLLTSVKGFTDGADQNDDITAMSIRL